ncbi:MAG TPA: dihydrofolate reductase family protein [Polyangiaceae bacterium]
MGNVFFDVGMSIDGFIAGPNGGPKTPLGEGGLALHEWMFEQKSFRAHLGQPGGETGPDDVEVAALFARIGSTIIGKRMFDEGEVNWPEEAPFRTDVFVLTHEKREPWIRPGGTTFHFVNDGIESALARAKESAGDKDVRIGGGADVIRQFIRAKLVDEMCLHFAPITLGKGIRLFDGIDRAAMNARLIESVSSTKVTHVRYALGP